MANATFVVKENPKNKKWYVKLNLEGKRTDRFGGYSEKEAHKKGIQLVAEYIKDPQAFFNKSKLQGVGITAMVEEFLNRAVDDRTNEMNRAHMEYVVEHYNLTQADDIDKFMLQRVKKDMRQDGAADGYVAMRLKIIRAFLNFCLDKHYIKNDPWPSRTDQKASGGQSLIPRYRSKGYYYPDEELRTLFYLSTNPTPAVQDLHDAMKISFIQGWREETVCYFAWERINFDRGTYHVEGLKGAIDREVPLLPDTLKILERRGPAQSSGRIFPRWGAASALGLAFRRWRRKAGLKRGRFHDLKHTCISKMIEAGYTYKEIEEVTNTSVAALQHYTHVSRKRLADKLADYSPLPAEPKKTDFKVV